MKTEARPARAFAFQNWDPDPDGVIRRPNCLPMSTAMNNDFSPPNHDCSASMIREYGKEHGITPQQLLDVFHEGILAIAEKYPHEAELRIAIMRGASPN